MNYIPNIGLELTNIPQIMIAARRWLLWKSFANVDPAKKPRKVPFYLNGKPRFGQLDTEEERKNLATFEECCQELELGEYEGLGFALGYDPDLDKHWQGIDLDSVSQWPGLSELASVLPGYVEVSPSGDGYHAIGLGENFPTIGASKSDGIECYASGRYFTVTGQGGQGEPEELSEFIQQALIPLTSGRISPDRLSPTEEWQDIPQWNGRLKQSLILALSEIPSDDYHLWIRFGQALHFYGDDGFALWHDWSTKSENYQGLEDCQYKWDTFSDGREKVVTVRSIFQMAKSYRAKNGVDEGSAHPLLKFSDWLDAEQMVVKPIDWLVRDYFEENTLSIIWGDTMAFKSFLSLDLCFCIAAGIPWYGNDVKQGTVLYVCGEGSNGISRRIAGLRQKYGVLARENIPLKVSKGGRDMADKERINNILRYGQSRKALGEDIKLVVFDTVNRNFTGEENSAKDVAQAFQHLSGISEKLDCSVLLVHHTGKSGATIRGSAAWTQNADASYQMERIEHSMMASFQPIKMKDAENGDPIFIEMEEVILAKKYTIGEETKVTNPENHVTFEEEEWIKTLVGKKMEEEPVSHEQSHKGPDNSLKVVILQALEENTSPKKKGEILDFIRDSGYVIDNQSKFESRVGTFLSRMVKSGDLIQPNRGVYDLPERM